MGSAPDATELSAFGFSVIGRAGGRIGEGEF